MPPQRWPRDLPSRRRACSSWPSRPPPPTSPSDPVRHLSGRTGRPTPVPPAPRSLSSPPCFPIGHHTELIQLGLAWTVAVVGSFVFEMWARIRGRLALETAAFVLVPLLVWALVAVGRDAPDWTAAAGLGSALPILAFAWWRGGHARVLAGGALLAVELPVVIVHAFGASGWNKAAVVLGTDLLLGLCCLFVSLWVRTAIGPESRWRGAHDLRRVFSAEAWLLMAGAAAGAVPAVELSWAEPGASGEPVCPLRPGAGRVADRGGGPLACGRPPPRSAGAGRIGAGTRYRSPPSSPTRSPSTLPASSSAGCIRTTHLAWIAAAIFVAGLIWSHAAAAGPPPARLSRTGRRGHVGRHVGLPRRAGAGRRPQRATSRPAPRRAPCWRWPGWRGARRPLVLAGRTTCRPPPPHSRPRPACSSGALRVRRPVRWRRPSPAPSWPSLRLPCAAKWSGACGGRWGPPSQPRPASSARSLRPGRRRWRSRRWLPLSQDRRCSACRCSPVPPPSSPSPPSAAWSHGPAPARGRARPSRSSPRPPCSPQR